MSDAGPRALYEYYERQNLLPTHAAFADAAAFERYAASRRALFEGKLGLPVRLFDGADLLEFGPDSGENSLAFAAWGARLTLVEPNAAALPAIRSYFERFGLTERIGELVRQDVLTFSRENGYDFVDAEGFIYTVPTDAWLAAFSRLLRPGGWFVISYYERSGALFELMLRALHAVTVRSTGWEPLEAAHRLYDAKWAAIPHTRAFESWVMDVLSNPFVSSRYFLDAATLWERAAKHGFAHYSSWPLYRDGLAVYWHKRLRSPGEEIEAARAHLRRSTLSFVAGEKCYLASDEDAQRAYEVVGSALAALEAAIIGTAVSESGVDATLAALIETARHAPAIEEPGARARLCDALESMRTAYALAARGDWDALAAFAARDDAFVRTWGMPAHFAAFRLSPA